MHAGGERPAWFLASGWSLAALVLVVFCLLRASGSEYINIDEYVTIAVAAQSVDGIIVDRMERTPPLWNLLVHLGIVLRGGDDAIPPLRWLSVLAAVLAIAVLYRVALVLLGPGPALTTALIAAVHPNVVCIAQFLRVYVLLALLVFVSGWALVRARGSGGVGAWAAYGLSVAGLLYGHLLGVFALVGQAVWLLVVAQRAGRAGWIVSLRWAMAAGLGVGLAVPWYAWRVLGATGDAPARHALGWTDVVHLSAMAAGGRLALLLLGPFLLVGSVRAVRAWRREGDERALAVLLLAVVPYLAFFALNALRPVFNMGTYTWFGIFPLLLLTGYGLAAIRRRWVWGAVVVLLALNTGRILQDFRKGGAHPVYAAAAFADGVVAVHVGPGDVIVFNYPMMGTAWAYLARHAFGRGEVETWYYPEAMAEGRGNLTDFRFYLDAGAVADEAKRLTDRIAARVAAGGRVVCFLADRTEPGDEPYGRAVTEAGAALRARLEARFDEGVQAVPGPNGYVTEAILIGPRAR